MPTDAPANAETPTGTDNAEKGAGELDISSLSEEQLLAHPKFKEMKDQHAAARTDMDQKNIEQKKLKAEIARLKALAGEEETPEPEVQPEYVTKDDLERFKTLQQFEKKHSQQIELAGEHFYQLVGEGKTLQDALDLALYRKGITNNATPKTETVSAPSAGPDRTGGTVAGVPEELLAQYQRSFPNLDKVKLAEIIQRNLAKSTDPNRAPAW